MATAQNAICACWPPSNLSFLENGGPTLLNGTAAQPFLFSTWAPSISISSGCLGRLKSKGRPTIGCWGSRTSERANQGRDGRLHLTALLNIDDITRHPVPLGESKWKLWNKCQKVVFGVRHSTFCALYTGVAGDEDWVLGRFCGTPCGGVLGGEVFGAGR